MFSATKLVGLAAAAALMGGVLTVTGTLNVQPDQPPVAAPAEQRVELTEVHGTREEIEQIANGTCDIRAGFAECHGDLFIERHDWDDDRLDGNAAARRSSLSLGGDPLAAAALTYYLENEAGSWAGNGYAYATPGVRTGHIRMILEGAGDYEGLTAILDFDTVKDPSTLVTTWQGTGVIVGPGLPELPEPATPDLLPE